MSDQSASETGHGLRLLCAGLGFGARAEASARKTEFCLTEKQPNLQAASKLFGTLNNESLLDLDGAQAFPQQGFRVEGRLGESGLE